MKISSLFSLTLFLLVAPGSLAAQIKCDCTLAPFRPDPPCFKECSTYLLGTASADALTHILGLSRELATRIVSMRRSAVKSLHDYEAALSPKERSELQEGLRALSQDKLDRLKATGEIPREKVIEVPRAGDLSGNPGTAWPDRSVGKEGLDMKNRQNLPKGQGVLTLPGGNGSFR